MPKHRVILRDDDTCATTPVPYLEQLYRPFLDRGLPVNLAVIPEVATGTHTPDGQLEGFLRNGRELPAGAEAIAVGEHSELIDYLRSEALYHIAHHGHRHDYFEFADGSRSGLGEKLAAGSERLAAAGLGRPRTFVAPYDQYCPDALREIADRFDTFSTGWFDRRRIPSSWLPGYIAKKIARRPHWRAGGLRLLSHPGCLLSYNKDRETMLAEVQREVRSNGLTVLVTHWWEYFDGGAPDRPFIAQLHKVARWLAEDPDVEVIAFDDLRD